MTAKLARLGENEEVRLIINGTKTQWFRMRNGADDRETKGIRVGPGRSKEIWEQIPLRSTFEATLEDNSGPEGPEQKRDPQVTVITRKGAATGLTPAMSRRLNRKARGSLFDLYEFADYSGASDTAQQRRAIKVARSEGSNEPELLNIALTREGLLLEILESLRAATMDGKRMMLGQDHQYSIPYGLAQEIGLDLDWRKGLKMLVKGTYAPDAPALDHPKIFTRPFNEFLVSHGKPSYFYSATKSVRYGIPDRNPREKGDPAVYRLCERYPGIFGTGNPKPLNRVGDNGSVGGQTLVGLVKIMELIEMCDHEGIPLKCWPYDGIDITSTDYEGCHVLIEPYPSAAGVRNQPRSDAEDAIAATRMISEADRNGTLTRLLDLTPLSARDQQIVKFEGWIVGHLPLFIRK